MQVLNKDSDYAIRLLMTLYRKGSSMPVREIARIQKVPYRFARKIFGRLSNAGIVGSVKGVGGGVFPLKKESEISILEIIELFQGRFRLSNCVLRGKPCPNYKICILRREMNEIARLMNKKLKNLTVKNLNQKIKGGK